MIGAEREQQRRPMDSSDTAAAEVIVCHQEHGDREAIVFGEFRSFSPSRMSSIGFQSRVQASR